MEQRSQLPKEPDHKEAQQTIQDPPVDDESGVRIRAQIESFSGPLPPPQLFEAYNKAQPDAGDRILKMAEGEQKHRHEIVHKVTDANQQLTERSQNWSGAITITAMISTVVLFALGAPVPGIALLLVSVTSSVNKLLNAIRKKIVSPSEQDEDEKEQDSAKQS